MSAFGLARWPYSPPHGGVAQGVILIPVSGVDDAQSRIREQAREEKMERNDLKWHDFEKHANLSHMRSHHMWGANEKNAYACEQWGVLCSDKSKIRVCTVLTCFIATCLVFLIILFSSLPRWLGNKAQPAPIHGLVHALAERLNRAPIQELDAGNLQTWSVQTKTPLSVWGKRMCARWLHRAALLWTSSQGARKGPEHNKQVEKPECRQWRKTRTSRSAKRFCHG